MSADFYTAVVHSDGKPLAIPHYSRSTEAQVYDVIGALAAAERRNTNGRERAKELGWTVEPCYLGRAPDRLVGRASVAIGPAKPEEVRAAVICALIDHKAGNGSQADFEKCVTAIMRAAGYAE